tara:strand:- start:117 stop:350 length:234 start_codon:yes stop_codon:yes gene_type:complete
MKLNINHLRAIKHFRKKKSDQKISDYEKFLLNYVSIPTARKIIKELIEFKFVKVTKSSKDLRIKNLQVVESNIDEYI